ncbi:hypothetical protein RND71_024582 [Anisodus tanguticus]|uniref:Lipoxygenase domain-containing protein n=1 Tax=Anisodus tanguticus TaxID=243964 RepID=A0AAE1RRD4_9SOLA|nr:hypothetical protein RND71_024582 [Anisodus tanguticus]
MPTPGTPEYAELESNHEMRFISGKETPPEWPSDTQPRHALERFRDKLVEIENRIMDRNNDNILKSRNGPVYRCLIRYYTPMPQMTRVQQDLLGREFTCP